MRINISDLFRYRQYVGAPVHYCFDKREYKICDISALETPPDTPYQRYIPLLRIDEKVLQDNYIRFLNDKHIWREYQETNLCFAAFVERKNLWNDWWKYYTTTVFELEKLWCEKNHLVYVFDL